MASDHLVWFALLAWLTLRKVSKPSQVCHVPPLGFPSRIPSRNQARKPSTEAIMAPYPVWRVEIREVLPDKSRAPVFRAWGSFRTGFAHFAQDVREQLVKGFGIYRETKRNRTLCHAYD